MFKRSKDANQQDMFSSIPFMLQGQSFKHYNDESAWHNMFRKQVLGRIDELLFRPLYDEAMGAPNAPIRILVGMLALKEGFGWSDNELFEECRFNLLVRAALGLFNINDSVPVESTYYLFRKRIHDYQKQTGEDIIEKVFQQITKGQVIDFQVSGRSIRMDSKLIGSNIAWCTRYEIVHNTLVLFHKGFGGKISIKLPGVLRKELEEISSTESKKVVYRLNREEIQEGLQSLGMLAHQLLMVFEEKDNENYGLLKRVFEEHFRVNATGGVEVLPKESIASGSVQNPNDTDCAYRDKDGQKVKGYSTNLTETCDEGALNLVVDVKLSPVNTPDVEFFQPAITCSAEVLDHLPGKAHCDGAFQSPENVEFCKKSEIAYFFNGIQGKEGRYDLNIQEGKLIVTDTHTGAVIPAKKARSGKWSIKTGDGKHRYFTQKEIDTCTLRKQIGNMPVSERNKRNNVEATIFQLSYHTRNNKTKYRGLFKNKMWATLRCIWINFKRIVKFIGHDAKKTLKMAEIIANNALFNKKQHQSSIFIQTFEIIITFFNKVSYLGLGFYFVKID